MCGGAFNMLPVSVSVPFPISTATETPTKTSGLQGSASLPTPSRSSPTLALDWQDKWKVDHPALVAKPMHPCLEGSLSKALLEHFFDYNLYAMPQGYPYYYEPNSEHSPKTRIPFCERSGEQPPTDDVGHPGDIYLVLPLAGSFQLYGNGANGWQRWSIGGEVRHPQIVDRFLWCNERAASWLSRTMVEKHQKLLLDQGLVKKGDDRRMEATGSDVESLILHRLLDETPLAALNAALSTKRPLITDDSPQKKPRYSSMTSASDSAVPPPVVPPDSSPRPSTHTQGSRQPSHHPQTVRIPPLGGSSNAPAHISAGLTPHHASQSTLPPNVPQPPAAVGRKDQGGHPASHLPPDSKTNSVKSQTSSSVIQDGKDRMSSQMEVNNEITGEQPQSLSPRLESLPHSKLDTPPFDPSSCEADSKVHSAKLKSTNRRPRPIAPRQKYNSLVSANSDLKQGLEAALSNWANVDALIRTMREDGDIMLMNLEAEKLAREMSDVKLKKAEDNLRAEKAAREMVNKEVEKEKAHRLAMESVFERFKQELQKARAAVVAADTRYNDYVDKVQTAFKTLQNSK